MTSSVIALRPVPAPVAVRRHNRVSGDALRGIWMVLVWLLLLVTALAAEVAVVSAFGIAVRMIVLDAPAHQYDMP